MSDTGAIAGSSPFGGRLKGKVAIVTGSGGGIGEGLARRLAAEGCSIVVADIVGPNAERVAFSMRDEGADAVYFAVDVTRSESVRDLFACVMDHWGRLDLLVNNAGLIKPKFVTDVTEEDWDSVVAVNLRGTFLCSQAAARIMIEQRNGAIVNMSSKSGKKGGQWLAAYCATKAGIIGLTQSMAMDLAAFGIRVNAVCPGNVFSTPMWETLFEPYAKKLGIPVEKVREHYNEKVPLGRECRVDDIANVVVFLASDDASYMTGQAINVTGGQEMG